MPKEKKSTYDYTTKAGDEISLSDVKVEKTSWRNVKTGNVTDRYRMAGVDSKGNNKSLFIKVDVAKQFKVTDMGEKNMTPRGEGKKAKSKSCKEKYEACVEKEGSKKKKNTKTKTKKPKKSKKEEPESEPESEAESEAASEPESDEEPSPKKKSPSPKKSPAKKSPGKKGKGKGKKKSPAAKKSPAKKKVSK